MKRTGCQGRRLENLFSLRRFLPFILPLTARSVYATGEIYPQKRSPIGNE